MVVAIEDCPQCLDTLGWGVVLLSVYGTSLSVLFNAEPQVAIFLDTYFYVQCYTLIMNVN